MAFKQFRVRDTDWNGDPISDLTHPRLAVWANGRLNSGDIIELPEEIGKQFELLLEPVSGVPNSTPNDSQDYDDHVPVEEED